jgi:hypothetical protein
MALDFDGSTQYVDTGQNSDLTEWTIMAWIYAHDAISGATQKVFDRSTNYQIIWDHTAEVCRGATALKVGSTWYTQKFGTLNNNTIYHLAASFGNNSLKTYQDGSYIGANTSMSGNPLSQVGNARIAGELGVTGWFFDGLIWDVRVYNRVLSANEIAEIYHKRGADRVWEGLVGWWRLDDLPSGTPAPLLLDAMDATTGWTTDYGVVSLNTTTYKEGSGALNMIKTTTTVSWNHLYRNITAVNLTNQTIKLWVYIKDSTALNKIKQIEMTLGQDVSNRYQKIFNSLSTGWNLLSAHIDDFSVFKGSPNKTAVDFISVVLVTVDASNTLAEGDVIFDFYRAGDYVPNSIIDLSGNGNHGTPYNSPVYQASPHRLRRGVLVS